jgi:hypothetical protein
MEVGVASRYACGGGKGAWASVRSTPSCVHPLPSPPADPLALAVTFSITGGNNNRGWPAFGVNAHTGALYVASEHDFESTQRVYNLTISLTDDGTAAHGPPSWTIPFNVTAIMTDVNERPLFQTVPNDSVALLGERRAQCCGAVAALPSSLG